MIITYFSQHQIMSKKSQRKSLEDEEYGSFLFSNYGINPETGGAVDARESKGSTKFRATQNLHKLGLRLKDGHSLLLESQAVLQDGIASKSRKREAHLVISTLVAPLMAVAAKASTKSANLVSPIARSE